MYVMGIDPTKVKTSTEGPEFRVGTLGATVGVTGGPKVYVYVQATGSGGITAEGYVGIIAADGTAAMITTALAAAGTGAGKRVGVGTAAVAQNGYCWLQLYGACAVRAAAAAAVYTLLGTTTTPGGVDDVIEDVTMIHGLVLTAASGGAATVTGFANWPQCAEITNDA